MRTGAPLAKAPITAAVPAPAPMSTLPESTACIVSPLPDFGNAGIPIAGCSDGELDLVLRQRGLWCGKRGGQHYEAIRKSKSLHDDSSVRRWAKSRTKPWPRATTADAILPPRSWVAEGDRVGKIGPALYHVLASRSRFYPPYGPRRMRATDFCSRPASLLTIRMPMNKPHLEFHPVDLASGWVTPPGYPAGIRQKILASDLDEARKSGSRTRLLRFEPGVYTTAPFVHDHWEEVYLLAGDLIVGNDAAGNGGEAFEAPTYACRPPGVHHGPFKSNRGCTLFEIHYYDESRR
jgi:hypothetical protein